MSYVSCGKIVEGFDVLPSINISWLQTTTGIRWYVQFAWLFWYVLFGNTKIDW